MLIAALPTVRLIDRTADGDPVRFVRAAAAVAVFDDPLVRICTFGYQLAVAVALAALLTGAGPMPVAV